MEIKRMTSERYRKYLCGILESLEELTEAPSDTATRDSFVCTLRLQFEITRELYKLDHENDVGKVTLYDAGLIPAT